MSLTAFASSRMASAASANFSPIVSSSPAPSSKRSMKPGTGGPDSTLDVRGIKLPKLSATTGTTGLQIKANAQLVSPKINIISGACISMESRGKNEDRGMLVDPFGHGWVEQDGKLHRQNFMIRSYEIGPDGTVSAETLMNHFQETKLNHIKCTGLMCDGFGSTPEMSKRDLIWVVSKMQILVDCYPSWGDVVEMTTWFSVSGKNGVRYDCLVCDANTGQTCARATSSLVMINKKTRKFSKIPEEVWGEIKPYQLAHCDAIVDEYSRKIPKLDANSTAGYLQKSLVPRWSDLDVNQHVNNVKYIVWIFESTPRSILENHALAGITLEYKRECKKDSILRSLTAISTPCGKLEISSSGGLECHHLICLEDGAEVLRGRTLWRPKQP